MISVSTDKPKPYTNPIFLHKCWNSISKSNHLKWHFIRYSSTSSQAIWYFFSLLGWWPSQLKWAHKHHPQQSKDDRQAEPLWCKPCLRLAQDDGTSSHSSIAGLLADCRLMGSRRQTEEITSFSLMPFLLLQNLPTKKNPILKSLGSVLLLTEIEVSF